MPTGEEDITNQFSNFTVVPERYRAPANFLEELATLLVDVPALPDASPADGSGGTPNRTDAAETNFDRPGVPRGGRKGRHLQRDASNESSGSSSSFDSSARRSSSTRKRSDAVAIPASAVLFTEKRSRRRALHQDASSGGESNNSNNVPEVSSDSEGFKKKKRRLAYEQ